MDKLLFWLCVGIVAILAVFLFHVAVAAWGGAPSGLKSMAANT